eukprot:SAG31_NODE_33482_length_343_cov_0.848361_1_plen_111_part_01
MDPMSLTYDPAAPDQNVTTCSYALDNFGCPQVVSLVGNNIVLEGGMSYYTLDSAELCARICLLNAACLSFDYGTTDQRCYLGSSTVESGGQIDSNNLDYNYYPREMVDPQG